MLATISTEIVEAECTDDVKKVAYCKTFDSQFEKRVAGEAQEYLKGCETWFDGCNSCSVDTAGKLTGCTKKFCEVNEKAYCSKKVGAVVAALDSK
jgi:hypothetical protein